jgi:hypothetical protein
VQRAYANARSVIELVAKRLLVSLILGLARVHENLRDAILDLRSLLNAVAHCLDRDIDRRISS